MFLIGQYYNDERAFIGYKMFREQLWTTTPTPRRLHFQHDKVLLRILIKFFTPILNTTPIRVYCTQHFNRMWKRRSCPNLETYLNEAACWEFSFVLQCRWSNLILSKWSTAAKTVRCCSFQTFQSHVFFDVKGKTDKVWILWAFPTLANGQNACNNRSIKGTRIVINTNILSTVRMHTKLFQRLARALTQLLSKQPKLLRN